MTRTAALLLALLGGAAAASPRVAVVGEGDCRDAELGLAIRNLSDALARQGGMKVLEVDAALGLLGRGPTRSVEEIQAQIDGARQQFYQAKYHKAVGEIEAAQLEIQRLPPGQVRWGLWVGARIIEGLIRTRLKRDGGSEDAFRHVLRLEPAHQLDRDYYGPSTLALFERVRAELQKAKRARLSVTSTPSGAEVFLDGRRVGVTPYAADHLPGRYQLVVGRGGAFSIPRDVEVGAQAESHVDLRFEGTVETSRAPCVAAPQDVRAQLGPAVKLGGLLDVDQVVVLRFKREKVGASWLHAALVGVRTGERVREGGLRVGAAGVTGAALAELARFLATGEATPNVRPTPSEPGPTAASTEAPGTASTDAVIDPATEAAPSSAEPATSAEVTAAAGAPSGGWRRPAGQALLGAGGASAIAGAVALKLGFDARAKFERLSEGGLQPDEAADARAAADRADRLLPLGYAGLGLGIVAAGAGAVLWLTAPAATDSGPSVSVLPLGPSSAAVLVRGRF